MALVTIAVGYDGSPDSVAALRWAARLAVQCQARLKVLHAVGLLEHAGLAATRSPHTRRRHRDRSERRSRPTRARVAWWLTGIPARHFSG